MHPPSLVGSSTRADCAVRFYHAIPPSTTSAHLTAGWRSERHPKRLMRDCAGGRPVAQLMPAALSDAGAGGQAAGLYRVGRLDGMSIYSLTNKMPTLSRPNFAAPYPRLPAFATSPHSSFVAA